MVWPTPPYFVLQFADNIINFTVIFDNHVHALRLRFNNKSVHPLPHILREKSTKANRLWISLRFEGRLPTPPHINSVLPPSN